MPGILKSIRREKQLYKGMLEKNGSPVETRLRAETKYKNYRTLLQKIKRKAKQSYYHDRYVEFKGNTKKLWGIMNSAVNKLSDKSSVIDELTVDGVKITNPDSIANSLGNYFATVGDKFAQRIATPTRNIDEYIKKNT